MIPGLDVDEDTVGRIRQAFTGWADHFHRELSRGGIAQLLREYEALIRSVETQSCSHVAGSKPNTRDDWRACCGLSYEYLNDLSVRDALQIIMDAIPSSESARIMGLVGPLDFRLRRQLFSAESEASVAKRAGPVGGAWWRLKLPDVIAPEPRAG